MSRTNTLVLFLSYVFMFLSMLVHGDSIRGSIAIAMGEEPSGAGTGGGLQASQGVLGNATLNPNAWKRPAEWILYTFTVVMSKLGRMARVLDGGKLTPSPPRSDYRVYHLLFGIQIHEIIRVYYRWLYGRVDRVCHFGIVRSQRME